MATCTEPMVVLIGMGTTRLIPTTITAIIITSMATAMFTTVLRVSKERFTTGRVRQVSVFPV